MKKLTALECESGMYNFIIFCREISEKYELTIQELFDFLLICKEVFKDEKINCA